MQVVGARPQFVKLAPVSRAIEAATAAGERIECLVVHTGQHYDPAMSDVFFEELRIAPADVHLGVGSGSHGQQTARMIEGLEAAFEEHRPDMVLTYGDTNSTLAASIAAAKLHLPLAHVEAGLRSFDRHMPEEVNRLVADHLSELLFAPTPAAMRNLDAEGLAARSQQVGDVMLDAVRFHESQARARSGVLQRLGLDAGRYLVATIHRAANTDGDALATLAGALADASRPDCPVVFPVHPRTAGRLRQSGIDLSCAQGLRAIEPLGYLDMIRLVADARIVLTDSGGLQKEAFFLGRPCITLREETEWVETTGAGANILAGADPARIRSALEYWNRAIDTRPPDFSELVARTFGDGNAAARIVSGVLEFLRCRKGRISS
jgi:UDP-N-acetylglucosamine 2-epimerase